jgi:hypothetical protein
MEELAEISQQRRAIAMAGARSKPDLGTSSISMFRYADNSKKKPVSEIKKSHPFDVSARN